MIKLRFGVVEIMTKSSKYLTKGESKYGAKWLKEKGIEIVIGTEIMSTIVVEKVRMIEITEEEIVEEMSGKIEDIIEETTEEEIIVLYVHREETSLMKN